MWDGRDIEEARQQVENQMKEKFGNHKRLAAASETITQNIVVSLSTLWVSRSSSHLDDMPAEMVDWYLKQLKEVVLISHLTQFGVHKETAKKLIAPVVTAPP